MYGTQDASIIWAKTWSTLLQKHGYVIGVSNGSLFHHPGTGTCGLVHGDDFLAAGPVTHLHWLQSQLNAKFECKHQLLGPSEKHHKGDSKKHRKVDKEVT